MVSRIGDSTLHVLFLPHTWFIGDFVSICSTLQLHLFFCYGAVSIGRAAFFSSIRFV